MPTNEDYKALFELEQQKRAHAEARQREAEARQREAEARLRKTTLIEFLHKSYSLLSPLIVAAPSDSTTGTIPIPKGKYCLTRLEKWKECPALHQQLYRSVLKYLQPTSGAEAEAPSAPRLFASHEALESLSTLVTRQAISSEGDLDRYEYEAVNFHVGEIISELCKIPTAREELSLGFGIRFANHHNSLEQTVYEDPEATQPSVARRPKPDVYCIHAADEDKSTLLTSGEHKPPHKLTMDAIRLGLRPMNLWHHLVESDSVSKDEVEKRKYRAEQLICSAIVQQYHVMIQDGLEVSYLTNGLCDIHLWVPEQDPTTLYFHLFEPNYDVDSNIDALSEPRTAIARRLCLYLLSHRYTPRGQVWINEAQTKLRIWQTRYQLETPEVKRNEALNSEPTSAPAIAAADDEEDRIGSQSYPKSPSDYEPISSSPSQESPRAQRHNRKQTSSSAACHSLPYTQRGRSESPTSSDPDTKPASSGLKRRFGQMMTSSAPPAQRPRSITDYGDNTSPQHDAQFCTLRCLIGLDSKGALDENCPNVKLHRQGQGNSAVTTHGIDTQEMVHLLKKQLESDLNNNCSVFEKCGAYSAPFKLTLASHGYTVVGKGTITGLWHIVSREVEVYRLLKKAQASAVPVFLGQIDLQGMTYFLRGAGAIQHMLIMGWGGREAYKQRGLVLNLDHEVERSVREVRSLGVRHLDPRDRNILWNEELQRALLIDFHQSKVDLHANDRRLRRAPKKVRPRRKKRPSTMIQSHDDSRLSVYIMFASSTQCSVINQLLWSPLARRRWKILSTATPLMMAKVKRRLFLVLAELLNDTLVGYRQHGEQSHS